MRACFETEAYVSRLETSTDPKDPVLHGRQVFRSRPISLTACAGCSPIPTIGHGPARFRSATGCGLQHEGLRCCRPPIRCWSRPSPARHAETTWSATPSRAASRTQTLGMLLTRRLEARARAPPRSGLRCVGTISLAIWGAGGFRRADPHRPGCRSTSCSTRGNARRRPRGMAA